MYEGLDLLWVGLGVTVAFVAQLLDSQGWLRGVSSGRRRVRASDIATLAVSLGAGLMAAPGHSPLIIRLGTASLQLIMTAIGLSIVKRRMRLDEGTLAYGTRTGGQGLDWQMPLGFVVLMAISGAVISGKTTVAIALGTVAAGLVLVGIVFAVRKRKCRR